MGFVTWKLEHIPFDNGWDEAEKTVLSSYYNPLVKVNLGDKRDSFEFKVTNFNGTKNAFFKPEDKIIISRVVNSATFPTDDSSVLMIGTVKDAPLNRSANQNEIRVEGYNFSESVAGAIVFADPTGLPIDEGLQLALSSATSKNANFKVTWDAGNPSVTTTGTSFPDITERFFYQPLRNILEKYSTSQRTKDGNYYWLITTRNTLKWRNQNAFGSGTFDATVDPYIMMKTGKDVKGIKNSIIAKGGIDPAGNQIMIPYRDWTSIARHNEKFQFLVGVNANAKVLNKLDLVKSYGSTTPTDTYPILTSDFTTAWLSFVTATVSGINMVEGSPVTITGSTEAQRKERYVAVLRKQVVALLEDEARRFIDSVKYGKYTIDVEFRPGTKSWGLGQQIQCTIPSEFDGVKTLRVTEIQYGSDSDAFTLEEDIGTLGATT